MPRPLSLPTLPFRWYYFVRTAANKRKIISDRSETREFGRLLTSTLAKCGAHLHFAHVDEHEVHLALQSGDGSLSGALGSFCQRYARRINRFRNERGALFRPHAHLLLVQQERWFLPLGRYIHWIPHLRSGDFSHTFCWWNTDMVYRNRQSVRGLVTSLTFRTLSRGSRMPRAQDQAYRAFFDQKPSQNDIKLFKTGAVEDARILGDSTFISNILQQLGLSPQRHVMRWSNSQEEIQRVILTLIETFQSMCDKHLPGNRARGWKRLVTLENVCSKLRAQPLAMIRGLIASYVVGNRIATLRQAERLLRCRPGTLSSGRRRRYEAKFRDLFNQPYEELFQAGGGSPPTSANGVECAKAAHQKNAEAIMTGSLSGR